jgi:transposase
VRNARVWRALLGVDEAVVEKVEFDEDRRAVVGHVRPVRAARGRCGVCQRRCGRYDAGEGRRRWRTLDLGSVQSYIEADVPRVSDPLRAFDQMKMAAKRIAHTLDGELVEDREDALHAHQDCTAHALCGSIPARR